MRAHIEIPDAEKFIRIWQKAKTVDEVVEELRLDKDRVLQKANYYRAHKIPLKKMPKGIKAIDWEALIRFAEKHHNN